MTVISKEAMNILIDAIHTIYHQALKIEKVQKLVFVNLDHGRHFNFARSGCGSMLSPMDITFQNAANRIIAEFSGFTGVTLGKTHRLRLDAFRPNLLSGELKKLGHQACPSYVRDVLRRHGLPPVPGRKGLSWKQFLQSHMDVTWAADFFTEEVWTLGGLVTFYALFFLHLGSRRGLDCRMHA